MNWREFSYDPLTGERVMFAHDPVTRKNHFRTEQDVEPLLDFNKALANHDDKGWTKSREMRRAASIPAVIIEKWLVEDGIDVFKKDHWPAVKRKLNSSDWAFLRTAPGRL